MSEAVSMVLANEGLPRFDAGLPTAGTRLYRLQDVPLSALLTDQHRKPQSLVYVEPSTTIRNALTLMACNDFHAVPVRDSVSSFSGILNVFDLLDYVLDFDNLTGADPAQLESELFNAPVEQALGRSRESRVLWAFNETQPLGTVLDAFGKDVHRVLVHEHGRRSLPAMLTQGDVARFLAHHLIRQLPSEQLALESLGLGVGPSPGVVTIQEHESALQGFGRIAINDVSAIAVVNEQGELIGTLSASDIRGITADNVHDLFLPAGVFIQKRTRARQHAGELTAQPHEKLSALLQRMLNAHVHRLWILDERRRPRSVVTLSDIIAKFSTYALSIHIGPTPSPSKLRHQ